NVLGLSLGITEEKLRFFNEKGELVLAPDEIAQQQTQRADQQQREKEQEQQKRIEAEAALAALLQSLRDRGINPDDLV
ncbi:MAG: Uma2 family endonuclease, partial [Symploca sp. SIO2E6]|nr:Uma2 family endonuclease [Symploca sp. SIO2E6]